MSPPAVMHPFNSLRCDPPAVLGFSLILPARFTFAWRKPFEPPRESPLTLHHRVVRRPLAHRSPAAARRRDEPIKRQKSQSGIKGVPAAKVEGPLSVQSTHLRENAGQ